MLDLFKLVFGGVMTIIILCWLIDHVIFPAGNALIRNPQHLKTGFKIARRLMKW